MESLDALDLVGRLSLWTRLCCQICELTDRMKSLKDRGCVSAREWVVLEFLAAPVVPVRRLCFSPPEL